MSETLGILTAAPVNNDSVSLIFLRLPDGNLDGNGFYQEQRQQHSKNCGREKFLAYLQ